MSRREFPSEIMQLVDRVRNSRENATEEDIKRLAEFVLDEDAELRSAPITETEALKIIKDRKFNITDRVLGCRYISGELRAKPRSYLAIVIPPGRHGIGMAADYLREYLDQEERHKEVLKSVKRTDSKKLIQDAKAFLAGLDPKPPTDTD